MSGYFADGAFFIGFTGYIHRAAVPGSCYAFMLAAGRGLDMLIVAAIAINTKWAFHSSLTHRFLVQDDVVPSIDPGSSSNRGRKMRGTLSYAAPLRSISPSRPAKTR